MQRESICLSSSMTLRILLGLCFVALVAADGYNDYQQPNNQLDLAINENANAINMAANVYEMVADQRDVNIPQGYDYRPRQAYAPVVEDYNGPVNYQFNYGVNDEFTGDIKSHSETREGYLVRGVYSLIDPDGFRRTVTYTVDGPSGFQAVVNREPVSLLDTKLAPALQARPAATTVNNRQQQPASPMRPRDSYNVLPGIQTGDQGPYA